ncbi:MAG: type IV secretory system conjugative DNA transfer family protein [Gammaproteobacteria bacterium]
MTELTLGWFECFPPRDLKHADLTGMLRVLAGRPRHGVLRLTPIVNLEVWLTKGRVRWLLGMDASLARSLPAELRAQLPGLGLVPVDTPERPLPTTAREVRCDSLASPLRLDTAGPVAAGVLQVAGQLGNDEAAVVQWLVGPSHGRAQQPTQFSMAEAVGLRPLSKPDTSERPAWKAKIAEPLFGVRGRVGATASTAQRAGAIMRPLVSALSLANGPHARLRASRQSSRTAEQLSGVLGRARTWSGIVNATELAALLGWPLEGVEVPGQVIGFGRAPSALLLADDEHETSLDTRVLGRSLHPADGGRSVRLPATSCISHVHVIGPTGSGKSNELAQWIVADAAANRSVLVIEPKGDLVDDVLSRLPESRHNDVVVIEPGEAEAIVGFNPLTGACDQAERRADELLGLFRELFGTAIGPRSSDVLLHALITAARLDDGTLTDVPALLTNAGFRRAALAKVTDPLVLAPFWAWFDGISDAERAQVVAPVLNKLRVLVSRPALRRMLGQATLRFGLDELFTKRRVVLVNLNKGAIGPETARLLGALLFQQLWQAIQRRARVPAAQRHPVMIFVDEFQDFVGALDFGDVLAQARGLGVSISAAHQHLGQLNPALRAAVLANARSRLTFRPAQGDAKALADVLGADVSAADLERLGAYQAVARILVEAAPGAAFAVQTLPLGETSNDVAALKRGSAERYGVAARELDTWLRRRWEGPGAGPNGPIGVTRRRP